MSCLTLIRRSILIEAPTPYVYGFWRSEGLASVFLTPEESPAPLPPWSLEADDENCRLAWTFGTGPTREARMTFAPLEGNATWLVFTADWEAPDGIEETGPTIDELTCQVDRGLHTTRDLIEQRAAMACADYR